MQSKSLMRDVIEGIMNGKMSKGRKRRYDDIIRKERTYGKK